MGELVHTSRIKIVREKGPTRRAMIEGFDEPIYYGVHGGIKSFYVKCHLKVPAGKSGEAREAFSSYLVRCPAAQSVIGCIDLHDELVVEEMSG